MAGGAAQLGETLASAGGHRRVHRRRAVGRDRLVRHREHRRGDRSAGPAGTRQLEGQRRLAPRVVVVEPQLAPAGGQGGLAFGRLRPAPVLRRQRQHFLAVHRQRGPVGLDEERVIPGGRQVDPALETNRHVVVDALQVRQGEVGREARALGLDRFMADAFPDLAAVHREVEMPRHHRVAQQVVGDAFQLPRGQAKVGHAARRAALVGLAQEVDQAAVAVFPFERAQRHRALGQRLAALGVARRMAGRAAARMEKLLALRRRHGVGRLRREVARLRGKQELRELRGGGRAFRFREAGEWRRHRRARLDRMRIPDERLQVVRIHAISHVGQARRLLRGRERSVRRTVAGDTIQFFEQQSSLGGRVEVRLGDAGQADFRLGREGEQR